MAHNITNPPPINDSIPKSNNNEKATFSTKNNEGIKSQNIKLDNSKAKVTQDDAIKKKTNVELSSDAKVLNDLKAKIDKISDEELRISNEQKIAKLKAKIADETYQVDIDKISEQMLEIDQSIPKSKT